MTIVEVISGRGVNGAAQYCVRLSAALRRRGHVVLAVCRSGSWVAAALRGAHVDVVESDLDRWPPGELRRIAGLVTARRADVVHTHMSRAHFFGVLLRPLIDAVVVATAHSQWIQLHWRFNRLLRDRVDDAGASAVVSWLGYRDDAAGLMRAFDVLVIPSRSEPAGLVALEAMAAGVPVVATRVGGLPEYVADGDTGLLTPARDPTALGAAIVSLLNDSAPRARCAANAPALVQTRFSVDAHIGQVEATVDDATRRRRSAHDTRGVDAQRR